MRSKIITCITGGGMGDDPYHPMAWSGSSLALINAFKKMDIHDRAFGLKLNKFNFAVEAIPNYSFDRELWRRKVFLKNSFRNQLSKVACTKLKAEDKKQIILQLGAYANLRKCDQNNELFIASYQDGNAVERFASKFTDPRLVANKSLYNQVYDFEYQVAQDMNIIFTTSEYLRQSFINSFELAPEKVVNVDIGINLNALYDVDAYDKQYDTNDIVFIGKSEFERKGGDIVVKAMDLLSKDYPSATLHMIGPPPQLAERFNNPKIRFYGQLSTCNPKHLKMLVDIMQKAKCFVMPSRYEPLGIAPLEALFYRVPAIVTGEWALRDNVLDGETGLHCEYDNAEDLAQKIAFLLDNPNLCEKMGNAGRAFVRSKFDWDTTAKNIYNQCQSQTPPIIIRERLF